MRDKFNEFRIINFDEIEIGNDNKIIFNSKYHYTNIEDNNLFCVLPKDFCKIRKVVEEKEHFKRYGYYIIDDEDDEYYIENITLQPLDDAIKDFHFFKLAIDSKNNIYIKEQFSPLEVFNYWAKINQFKTIEKDSFLKKIGITNNIIERIPDNHNYYGRNLICNCGEAECDNLEVWIVKYENSFFIPFVVNLGKRLYFDIEKIAKTYIWEEEDYKYETYMEKSSYNTFPFCFEYPDFELEKNTLFPNDKTLENLYKTDK